MKADLFARKRSNKNSRGAFEREKTGPEVWKHKTWGTPGRSKMILKIGLIFVTFTSNHTNIYFSSVLTNIVLHVKILETTDPDKWESRPRLPEHLSVFTAASFPVTCSCFPPSFLICSQVVFSWSSGRLRTIKSYKAGNHRKYRRLNCKKDNIFYPRNATG